VKKIFQYLNNHFLFFLSCFLLAFIPLYPKIPLYQPIPGYIVRVRLEDIFMAIAVGWWFILFLQKKIEWRTPLNKWIALYLGVGFISMIFAFFIFPTVPLLLPHMEKTVLHFLRYIEYFSLFFIVFSSIKTQKQVFILIGILCFVVVATTLYGYGQRHFKWPVYSTMSRDFSSGIALELESEYARVPSTFAGHYDFAVYLSLVLPFILSSFYWVKKRNYKIGLGVVLLFGLWSLIVSALRSAFISFLFSATLVSILSSLKEQNLSQKIKTVLLKLCFVYVITTIMFVVFGNNILQLLVHAGEGLTNNQKKSLDQVIIPQYEVPQPKDPNAIPQHNDEVEVNSVSDTGQTIVTYEVKTRTLSDCAQKHELSLCIRLDSLWPQAIEGFLHYPILGKGYATLNKKNFYHLAEADGTDNNYLRTLGETGILGFVTFYGIVTTAFILAWKTQRSKNSLLVMLSVGYIGSVVAILLNAFLVDVFVASKVAFTFWGITGIFVGYYHTTLNKLGKKHE
jgi:hypothetical protein